MDNLEKKESLTDENIDQVSELSKLSVIQSPIHQVLFELKGIKPYRLGDRLMWRGIPTSKQQQLLSDHQTDLLAALTPRPID